MRTLAVLAVLTMSGLAQAQSFNFSSGPKADIRYVVEAASTHRFVDDETVAGPELKVGDEVERITEEEGRVRIKKDTFYGWISADKLAEAPPEPIE